MTYQEKMAKAIESAEKWQARVDAIEKDAEKRAKWLMSSPRARSRLAKEQANLEAVLVDYTKRELQDDVLYHSACANRNAQQTLAQMYATAALVAAQYGMVQ